MSETTGKPAYQNSTKIKAERNTVTEKPDAKVKRKLPDKPTSIHSKVAYRTSANALPKPKKPVKTIS